MNNETSKEQKEAVEVVAWRVSHPDHKWKVYDHNPSTWATGVFKVQELMTVAQHERIVAALSSPAQPVQQDTGDSLSHALAQKCAEFVRLEAELAALKAQQVGQEPVAWRYTSSLRVGGKWHYQETFPKWDDRKVHEIGQVQALYTAPQPAPAQDVAKLFQWLLNTASYTIPSPEGSDYPDAYLVITGYGRYGNAETALKAVITSYQAAQHSDHSRAAHDVLVERRRQVEIEGWEPDHDDEHDGGELAAAGAAYALHAADHLNPHSQGDGGDEAPDCWPWHDGIAGRGEGPEKTKPAWWKPGTPRRNLIKAGALILAEIERIDRAAQQRTDDQGGV